MARPKVKHAKRKYGGRAKVTKCNACAGPVVADGMGMSRTLCRNCMCSVCNRGKLLCECKHAEAMKRHATFAEQASEDFRELKRDHKHTFDSMRDKKIMQELEELMNERFDEEEL